MARLPQAEVVVYREWSDSAYELVARLAGADVVVLVRERACQTREGIARLARLRIIIVRTGRVARDSTADIDMAALTERSIATIEGESDGESAAAHTLALVLATRRRLPLLPRHLRQMKGGRWESNGLARSAFPSGFAMRVSLHGDMLGIWGYGRIDRILLRYGAAPHEADELFREYEPCGRGRPGMAALDVYDTGHCRNTICFAAWRTACVRRTSDTWRGTATRSCSVRRLATC